jgi:hypothetical protein
MFVMVQARYCDPKAATQRRETAHCYFKCSWMPRISKITISASLLPVGSSDIAAQPPLSGNGLDRHDETRRAASRKCREGLRSPFYHLPCSCIHYLGDWNSILRQYQTQLDSMFPSASVDMSDISASTSSVLQPPTGLLQPKHFYLEARQYGQIFRPSSTLVATKENLYRRQAAPHAKTGAACQGEVALNSGLRQH